MGMQTKQNPSEEKPEKQWEPNVLPATEIRQNPNPRANENIKDRTNIQNPDPKNTSGTGSEITDGEDA